MAADWLSAGQPPTDLKDWLKIGKLILCDKIKYKKINNLHMRKQKTQISFTVTVKLISAFVFATQILKSLFYLNTKFQASNDLLRLYNPVCVGPGLNPNCWFSHAKAHIFSFLY